MTGREHEAVSAEPNANFLQQPRTVVRAKTGGEPVLDAIEQGIVVIDASWRIAVMNRAASTALRPSDGVGSELWAAFPFLAAPPIAGALRATKVDGRARGFRVAVPEREQLMDARITRAEGDRLVLTFVAVTLPADFPIVASTDEQAALRTLAKQLAGVADSAALLDMLAEAARVQCRAAGAGVIAISNGTAEVVTASGVLQPAQHHRFELFGSLAQEALVTRRVVALDLDKSGHSVSPVARDLDLGPVALAPLVAHDTVLGVLLTARERGGRAFTPREEQRLYLIADHAALALWKADLLEKAQAADRAKGRFLATVSHELRTPLTALTGYEELLADQVIGPLSESQLDVLERMRSVTHHLTTVIEEVLAFSSLEDGRHRARATEFLAADLLRAVAAMVEPLARQKRLALEIQTPPEPVRITSDIDMLRQILVNVATNAVKFTESGSITLTVASQTRGGERWVRFGVCDTGVGIGAEDMCRLFRPFVQLDAGLTRRHGGTGLGLYISRRLVQLLGGTIDVESRLGAGSTFTVELPALLPVLPN